MTVRPLRVAHIVQNLNYGGMERLIADLVRLGRAHGLESHVVVLQYTGRFAQGLEAWGAVHQCPPMARWSLLWPTPLIRLLRGLAPDVVHSHSGVWYKATLAARRAGVPRVLHTEHGLPVVDTWLARVLQRRAGRRTDIVVSVSEALAQVLAGSLVRPDAVRVVPNGVDGESFRPRSDSGVVRRAIAVAADVPIIGSIGRLEPVKAYDVMIEAFARLRARWPVDAGPAPVLVLAGDGSERERLTAHAATHGVAGDVHLLGWRDDVHDLHSAFTLFSLSSLSEGTSVSLLEAMSAGLCPVITDVGGNAAVLGDGLRHRLVKSRDAAALADAWADALRDPQRRAADAAAARRRVETTFSLEVMARTYADLYRTADDAASTSRSGSR